MELTKEADALLCIIYKDFLENKDTLGMKRAAYRYGSEQIHERLTTSLSLEDIDFLMGELEQKGLVGCFEADNITAYEGWLTHDGILYMQKRFSKKAAIIKYLKELAPIIGFVKSFLG